MTFKLSRYIFAAMVLSAAAFFAKAQVIDVHMHSYTQEGYFGGRDHPTGIKSPVDADAHLRETIAEMDTHDIKYAVISGSLESVEKYVKADKRFIPGYSDPGTRDGKMIDPGEFEKLVREGRVKVFGEISAVYKGMTLADPIYEPYLKICEKYGIPVAYHTGGGPPMTPYRCCPDFRISKGDPLLIEDVLVKHPKLKIYLMHAGELYHREALRMMLMYQQVYVDLGVVLWVSPLVQQYAVEFLRTAKTAGVLDRVMYGSDQMVWPGGISSSIGFLKSMDFLSEEDKRMILYTNALTFLNLEKRDAKLPGAAPGSNAGSVQKDGGWQASGPSGGSKEAIIRQANEPAER